jgi:ABC-type bacteriocin/lantibiotic exporter with double-glycine peptidase domain
MKIKNIKHFSRPKLLNSPAWKYYISYYFPYRNKVLLSILVSIFQSAIFLPIAYLIRYIFDVAIPNGNYGSLLLIGLAIILLQLLNDGSTLIISYLILDVTKRVIFEMRSALVDRLYSFSRSYYTQADQSKLHTIIVQDTERLDFMTYSLFVQFIPKLFISLVLIVILFILNWYLSLIVLMSVPIVYVTSRTMGKKLKKRTNLFHESFDNFSKGIMFVLNVMDLTRLQAAEDEEHERQRSKFDQIRRTSGDMSLFRDVYYSVDTVFIATVSMIVLVAGGRAVATGAMSLGDLITFYAVVMFLRPRGEAISRSIPSIIEGNESLIRIFNLLDIDQPRPYSGRKSLEFQGKIKLQGVEFSYKDTPTLHDISMIFEPESKTAIIGPNGSGKTTIANLILGFYCPQSGHLFADDMVYEDLEMRMLRRQIAVVTQDPVLFPGTIFENITYGYPDKTYKQVEEAAFNATADKFIKGFPLGYETYIGEGGQLLSGGQRQRLAIARAFLNQPKLLILDEPTNHLDDQSVEVVMQNFHSLDSKPTVILISHDLKLIRNSDYIYLLEDGQIVSEGSYSRLFSKIDMVIDR